MDLGKRVLDKEILDRQGHRMGKVDDLLLEVPESMDGGEMPLPEVSAIISGPMALSANLSRPLRWLARQWYRLLGLSDPRPVMLPWSTVSAIDVVVHVAVDRDDTDALALEHAVERRFISRLPGA